MNDGGRVGVFGGTFDPIHVGHLAAVEDAASLLGLDRVLFVPNALPPHKQGQGVSEVGDRLAMVQLAVEDNPHFEVSLVEIERGGLSYTLDTLRLLRGQLGPRTELYFLVGCDALDALHTWHQPEQLLREFRVAVMGRPSAKPLDWDQVESRFPSIRQRIHLLDVIELDISSRDLRARVAAGRPIRYYVPPQVERYIRARGLYLSQQEVVTQ